MRVRLRRLELEQPLREVQGARTHSPAREETRGACGGGRARPQRPGTLGTGEGLVLTQQEVKYIVYREGLSISPAGWQRPLRRSSTW